MSLFQELLASNAAYAGSFDRSRLATPPARHLAVVACMDARLTVEEVLGLRTGDAHIIRNAGGIVTDDVIRSLIISHKLLGTREFLVINHTDCGMLTFTDEQLRQRVTQEHGVDASHLHFHAFNNVRANVEAQVQKIRQSPFIPKDIPVHGLIFRVEDGRLDHVVSA